MAITITDILKLDNDEDWLEAQPREELAKLVGRLCDMGLVEPQDEPDEDDVEWELHELLIEARDYVKEGRTEDALLTIERTLFPRRRSPSDADHFLPHPLRESGA